MKTIDEIKKIRIVSEALRAKVKADAKIDRTILKALADDEKTIPQIADEIKLESHIVTYHLMTLLKYGKVEAGEIDDMDEYYYYKLKK